MTNRNPYEKGVDIPDFVESRDDNIDMSLFKMDPDQEDEYEDDEEYEEPRRLSGKGIMIIEGVIIAILLVAAIAGWVFGISKSKQITTLTQEKEAAVEKYNTLESKVTSLETENASLLQENETLKASQQTLAKGEYQEYKFKIAVRVRQSGSSKSNIASYSKMSSEAKEFVNVDGDTVTVKTGVAVKIYETKTDTDGMTWGRIDDNAWVCLVDSDGETYATKQ